MGQRVASLRKDKGWTQGELAKKIGRDEQYLSKVERGERRPGPKTRNGLAAALGAAVEYIVTGVGARTRTEEIEALAPFEAVKRDELYETADDAVRRAYDNGLAKAPAGQTRAEQIAFYKEHLALLRFQNKIGGLSTGLRPDDQLDEVEDPG